jgi:hydrogenase expression/formation protein HypE
MCLATPGQIVEIVDPPNRLAKVDAEIGEVKTEPPGMVLVETAVGGRRAMDQLVGDPLPRIC